MEVLFFFHTHTKIHIPIYLSRSVYIKLKIFFFKNTVVNSNTKFII